MKEYNHLQIEKKWQKEWDKKKIYSAKEDKSKKKFFALIEFPYPSGAGLHVGHVRSNTAMDIISRKRRMEGYSVLYPIGWDAFGLPTEQYAIKTGTPPATVTKKNTDTFRKQLKSIGFGFDWAREINTTDPKYYKWTQWIFLQFYKKGLAYKAKTTINWCPKDKIGLANEEVVNGACERCGTPTEKKEKEQWMLAITKYAERLDKDLDEVDFLERIKIQQRNWIGKSEGSEIDFKIDGTNDSVTIFTTRADTLFGAYALVLAPEHKMVEKLLLFTENKTEVEKYISEAKKKDDITRTAEDKEKTGIPLRGVYAINPGSGEKIPVWIADFVLVHYGTGAIFADIHDERDFMFAKKYGFPLKSVLKEAEENVSEVCYTEEGTMINSGKYDGLKSKEARKKITEDVGGKVVTKFKLRDWVFSRQRYWGEPIPIVHCSQCGEVPVPEKELPLKLPKVKSYMPTDNGESPLAEISKWVNTKCPNCKRPAKRETDTMPNWAGSSWYYLRYVDPKNSKYFADEHKLAYWSGDEQSAGPVDWYNGGMEHTTLHLLYSRFWHKFLYDIGVVPTKEPYKKRTSHGMILADGGEKMSKSRGNVVNPDDIIKTFGADTFRLYEMFMGPFDQAVVWSTDAMVGPRRFVERVWKVMPKVTNQNSKTGNPKYEIILNQTIKKVGEDIESMSFNTAVSQMMMCLNEMEKSEIVNADDFKKYLKILSPFAPHFTEELWRMLGEKKSIHLSSWPEYDSAKLESHDVKIMIQINSKIRADITVARSATEEEIKKIALLHEKVVSALAGKVPTKFIYVPGRLLNIVA